MTRMEVSHVMMINPTPDPLASGDHYVSVGDENDHSTSVYDADGSFADVRANEGWEDVPRQD
jgi:hypothetical protein